MKSQRFNLESEQVDNILSLGGYFKTKRKKTTGVISDGYKKKLCKAADDYLKSWIEKGVPTAIWSAMTSKCGLGIVTSFDLREIELGRNAIQEPSLLPSTSDLQTNNDHLFYQPVCIRRSNIVLIKLILRLFNKFDRHPVVMLHQQKTRSSELLHSMFKQLF